MRFGAHCAWSYSQADKDFPVHALAHLVDSSHRQASPHSALQSNYLREGDRDMQTLLTVIVTWLSFNFALPANFDHPRIELVPPAQMTAVRSQAASSSPSGSVANGLGHTGPDIAAFYDDTRRT